MADAIQSMKNLATTIQQQNTTIYNSINTMKGESNLFHQKSYYMLNSRIYTAYIIIILKYIYYLILLILIFALFYSDKVNFYSKILIVVFLFLYQPLIFYIYYYFFPIKNSELKNKNYIEGK